MSPTERLPDGAPRPRYTESGSVLAFDVSEAVERLVTFLRKRDNNGQISVLSAVDLQTLTTLIMSDLAANMEGVWNGLDVTENNSISSMLDRKQAAGNNVNMDVLCREFMTAKILFNIICEYYGYKSVDGLSLSGGSSFIGLTYNNSMVGGGSTDEPSNVMAGGKRKMFYTRMASRSTAPASTSDFGKARGILWVGEGARLENVVGRTSVLRAIYSDGEGGAGGVDASMIGEGMSVVIGTATGTLTRKQMDDYTASVVVEVERRTQVLGGVAARIARTVAGIAEVVDDAAKPMKTLEVDLGGPPTKRIDLEALRAIDVAKKDGEGDES